MSVSVNWHKVFVQSEGLGIYRVYIFSGFLHEDSIVSTVYILAKNLIMNACCKTNTKKIHTDGQISSSIKIICTGLDF